MSNYLIHYASPYYDPVKAHEYYMQTRKLKGRSTSTRSTAKLSDEGKQIWALTKDGITQEKKGEQEEAKRVQKETTSSAREIAKAHKDSITSKLKMLNQELSARVKASQASLKSTDEKNQAAIQKKANDEVEKLYAQSPPEGLTDEEESKWRQERAAKVNEITSKANSEITQISSTHAVRRKQIGINGQNEKKNNSADAKAQRAEVASQLKEAVTQARESYKQKRTEIKDKYENTYQTEYDKILASHKKVSKRKKKSSS